MNNKDFGHLLTKQNREREDPQVIVKKALKSVTDLSRDNDTYVMDKRRTQEELESFFNKLAFHSEDYEVVYRVKKTSDEATVTVEIRQ